MFVVADFRINVTWASLTNDINKPFCHRTTSKEQFYEWPFYKATYLCAPTPLLPKGSTDRGTKRLYLKCSNPCQSVFDRFSTPLEPFLNCKLPNLLNLFTGTIFVICMRACDFLKIFFVLLYCSMAPLWILVFGKIFLCFNSRISFYYFMAFVMQFFYLFTFCILGCWSSSDFCSHLGD